MNKEFQMKNRSVLVTAGIVAVGVVLGLLILIGGKPSMTTEDHGGEKAKSVTGARDQAEGQTAKGPHGGRLFSNGAFALEVTIFEKGVPPEFRIYGFDKGKPVDPAEVKLQVKLERLGAPPETLGFRQQKDFLQSERVIAEPHSFKVSINAERQGKAYQWTYDQAEARIRMDAAAMKNAGIELRTAGPAKIRSALQLQGEIQFNQDRVAHVVPRLAGVVVNSAKNLGDSVKKGELLAVLESRTLADLKSEHLATQTRLDLAQGTFEREQRLWQEKISAQQDYLASRQSLVEG
jgi:membrane fusion protein, heavy metal efflux system